MVPNTRLRLALWLYGGAALLLAACQSVAPATPTVTSVVQATATQPAATSTSAPDTPTALPADAATPQLTTSPTASATVAPSPTATATPAAAPGSPTASPGSLTVAPTRPPVTITPLGPPETASVYSTTSGPAGYSSSIKCQRAGVSCAPVMSPGDVSFSLVLAGAAAAPWTHFVYYGLSVEKDGANVADMFMFVDAGWLQPGAVVGYGASRTFNQRGTYVIRSSGCMTTNTNSNNCTWTTIAGDVVTFDIQP
jgi:hypothetical protein